MHINAMAKTTNTATRHATDHPRRNQQQHNKIRNEVAIGVAKEMGTILALLAQQAFKHWCKNTLIRTVCNGDSKCGVLCDETVHTHPVVHPRRLDALCELIHLLCNHTAIVKRNPTFNYVASTPTRFVEFPRPHLGDAHI